MRVGWRRHSAAYRFRAFHVTDHDVAQLAERAARLRANEGSSTDHKVTDTEASAPASVPDPAAGDSVGLGKNAGDSEHPVGVPHPSVSPPTIPHRDPDVPLPANVVELPKGKGTKNAVRRLRIEMELRERNGRSFRQIAEAVAAATGSTCDHHTVAAVARELDRERSA